jgi:hypothetical protein
MKRIPLTQGQFAIVDDEDYNRLSAHKWHAWWSKWNKCFYARCYVNRIIVYMHREVLGLKKGDKREGDHGLRNTLDNRKFVDGKENLRIATKSQNQMNRPSSGRSSCGLKGIGWSKQKSRWRSRIMIDGKEIHLGFFTTKEAAYAAYCHGAELHHGKFARVA